jgi:hypothetical protein
LHSVQASVIATLTPVAIFLCFLEVERDPVAPGGLEPPTSAL